MAAKECSAKNVRRLLTVAGYHFAFFVRRPTNMNGTRKNWRDNTPDCMCSKRGGQSPIGQ
eukprot:894042-Karenia_brevis.AAC.1